MKLLSSLLMALAVLSTAAVAAEKKPMPENTSSKPNSEQHQTITMGGGCFWCMEAVFQRLKGVTKVVSGYAGGTTEHPTYKQVCTGSTGHAEVVQIEFDPAQLPLEKLLEVFWAAHDPTTLNRQGNDEGTQYRSVLFYANEQEKKAMEDSRQKAQKEFKSPIVTQIAPFTVFYPAEGYHQDYYNQNSGSNPYCSVVIRPKLQKLLHSGLIKE